MKQKDKDGKYLLNRDKSKGSFRSFEQGAGSQGAQPGSQEKEGLPLQQHPPQLETIAQV